MKEKSNKLDDCVRNRKIDERIAQLVAHRVCGNQEHNPLNGKIAGYCIVCQVPWLCNIAKLEIVANM